MKLTSQNEKQKADQQTIPHIEHPRRKASEAQLANPIQKRIGEHIERACPSCTEGSPLPMIILTAEQEVNEQDCDGGAGDYHDAIAEE